MVLTEDFKMSRTDEVHRITENVYKVKCLNCPNKLTVLLGALCCDSRDKQDFVKLYLG